MRHKKRICLLLAVLFTALLLLPACGGEGTSLSPLTTTFLRVGKADSIVLTCAEKTVVIDTGEADDGAVLLSFLKTQNAAAVDALIITHFDKDHVGGAAALLAGIEVKRVLTPAYTGSSAEYQSFVAAMEAAGITPEALTESTRFSFGDATVTVDPPKSYEIAGSADDADNDLSLITSVTHGSNRLLFTGDAENARLNEWMEAGSVQRCSLIKMPHHGAYHKALKTLLTATAPAYAVICDSDKNPAEEKTLTLLTERGIKTYETKNGNVIAVSDGKSVTVQTQAAS